VTVSPFARPLPEAEDLTRIRLVSATGLPVNVWVLRHGGRVTLVDSGFASTAGELVRQLALIGVALADVDKVLLTHTHEDHVGGAVVLADRWDAEVICREGTPSLLGNWYEAQEALPSWASWIDAFLPEGPLRERLLELRARRPRVSIRHGGTGELPRRTTVAVGEVVEAAGARWEMLDASGHDPWHVAWRSVDGARIFTGDVLLGVPTPIMPPMGDQLDRFRWTVCRWTREVRADVAYPGHGRSLPQMENECRTTLGFLETLWNRTTDALAGERWIDPGTLATSLPGGDDPRRLFLWLGLVHSQLLELQAMGRAERDDATRYWRAIAPLGSFEERCALDGAHFGDGAGA
jgi:glyoxylase-like metal-dependent hydrolase (beta-lactamase superfamily II)